MLSIFFHLLLLGYATVHFEGYMAKMPLTALILWLFISVCLVFKLWPDYVDKSIKSDSVPSFMRTQSNFQWLMVSWIIALQAFSAPATSFMPQLHKTFPQSLPMAISIIAYVTFYKLASGDMYRLFKPILSVRQTASEFFRARMTIPILFFPPMFVWLIVEDYFFQSPELSDIQDVQTMILAPVFFIGLYLVAPRLFNWAWHAEPANDKELEQGIVDISQKAEAPVSGVRIWDTFNEPIPNAAVAGLSKQYRFVYITKYLLDIFSPAQVKAVLAHELAHLRLGHVITYMIFSLDLVFLSVAVKLSAYFHYPHSFLFSSDMGAFVELGIFLLFFLIIFTAIARKSEYQADKFASAIVGKEVFASSLESLQQIISPAPSKIPSWMLTHPEIQDRIDSVKNWQGTMQNIVKQAKKIRWTLIALGLVFVVCSAPAIKIMWTVTSVSNARKAGNLFKASALISSLPTWLNDHPLVSREIGKLAMTSGHWGVALLSAAEASWNCNLHSANYLEVLHHPVSPEVAFNFKLMQLLLKAFNLG